MTIQDKDYSFFRSYVKGEAFFGFWGVVSSALSVLISFLIISHLDVYKYGLYLLVISFYSLISGWTVNVLSEIIFNDIARYLAEKKEREAKRLYLEDSLIRIFLAVIICVIVFWGANLISNYYGKDIASFVRSISFMFVINATYLSMKNLFNLKMYFGTMSFRPVVFKILKCSLIVFFISWGEFGVREALLSYVWASFFSMVLFMPLFWPIYKQWSAVVTARGKIIFLDILKKHGKWSVFNQIISSSVADLKPWFIKVFVNTEGVAIFSVAETIFGAVKIFFPISTLSALLPKELVDKKRMGNILLRGTKYLTIYGLLLGAGSFVVLPPVIKFFFPQYVESIGIFQFLLIILPLLSFRSIASGFLVALRQQRFLFFVSLLKIFLTLLLSGVLVYLWGVWGMALQRILISVFLGGIMYFYLLKKENLFSLWKNLFWFDQEDKIFIKKIWGQCLAVCKGKFFNQRK